MRKCIITTTSQDAPHLDEGWLDLDSVAMVEVTSEAKEYPVEFALVSGEMRGWRADTSDTQTIRLIFDEPQKLTQAAREIKKEIPETAIVILSSHADKYLLRKLRRLVCEPTFRNQRLAKPSSKL